MIVTTSRALRLAVRQSGPPAGRPIVVLHGVAGTGATVLKGDELERRGFRVVTFDARGHGDSDAPADPRDYRYDALVDDLRAVMDAVEAPRAVLVGVSMGGLTALRLALEEPDRVAALAIVAPAYDPDDHPRAEDLERLEQVSMALRARDPEAFVAANPLPTDDPAAAGRFARWLTQRLAAHRDLAHVADALEVVLRERPFESWARLREIRAPALVVGSNDTYDPQHPLASALACADALEGSRFECEADGHVPIAWRGRVLTRLVADVATDPRVLWQSSAEDGALTYVEKR